MYLLWYCLLVKQFLDITKNVSCFLNLDVKACPETCTLGMKMAFSVQQKLCVYYNTGLPVRQVDRLTELETT